MSGADLSLHVIQPFRPVPPAADHRRRERNSKPFDPDRLGTDETAAETRGEEAPRAQAPVREDGIGEHIDIVA